MARKLSVRRYARRHLPPVEKQQEGSWVRILPVCSVERRNEPISNSIMPISHGAYGAVKF